MGAGKTTIGRKLAQIVDYEFVDMDQLLEERTGVTVSHIFEIEGEEGFRCRETRLLEELSAAADRVVSTGGGIVTQEESRDILASQGTVVYLQADFDILWARLRNCQTRPLLQTDNPAETLKTLIQNRAPLYESVADLVFPVSNDSSHKAARRLLNRLDELQEEA